MPEPAGWAVVLPGKGEPYKWVQVGADTLAVAADKHKPVPPGIDKELNYKQAIPRAVGVLDRADYNKEKAGRVEAVGIEGYLAEIRGPDASRSDRKSTIGRF